MNPRKMHAGSGWKGKTSLKNHNLPKKGGNVKRREPTDSVLQSTVSGKRGGHFPSGLNIQSFPDKGKSVGGPSKLTIRGVASGKVWGQKKDLAEGKKGTVERTGNNRETQSIR